MSDTSPMKEEQKTLAELRVTDLRTLLEARELDKTGLKPSLVDRLKEAMIGEGLDPETHKFSVRDVPKSTARKTLPGQVYDEDGFAVPAMTNGARVPAGGGEGECNEELSDTSADANVVAQQSADIGKPDEVQPQETTPTAAEPATGASEQAQQQFVVPTTPVTDEQQDISTDSTDAKQPPQPAVAAEATPTTQMIDVPPPDAVPPQCPFTPADTIALHAAAHKQSSETLSMIVETSSTSGMSRANSSVSMSAAGETGAAAVEPPAPITEEPVAPAEQVQQPVEKIAATAVVEDVAMDETSADKLQQHQQQQPDLVITVPDDEHDSQSVTTPTAAGTVVDASPPKPQRTATTSADSPAVAAASKSSSTTSDTSKKAAETNRNLWVTGLSADTRAADLKALFSKYGHVAAAKIITSTKAPGNRCYGYVTMSTDEQATKCIQHLHRAELNGKTIGVERTRAGQLPPGIDGSAKPATPVKKSDSKQQVSTRDEPDIITISPEPAKTPKDKANKDKDKKPRAEKRAVKRLATARAPRRHSPSQPTRGGRPRIQPAHRAPPPRTTSYASRRIQQARLGGRRPVPEPRRRMPPPLFANVDRQHMRHHPPPLMGRGGGMPSEMLVMEERRRAEDVYRRDMEKLKLERERERIKYERERLEREKLELQQLRLAAQQQQQQQLAYASTPVRDMAAYDHARSGQRGSGGGYAQADDRGRTQTAGGYSGQSTTSGGHRRSSPPRRHRDDRRSSSGHGRHHESSSSHRSSRDHGGSGGGRQAPRGHRPRTPPPPQGGRHQGGRGSGGGGGYYDDASGRGTQVRQSAMRPAPPPARMQQDDRMRGYGGGAQAQQQPQRRQEYADMRGDVRGMDHRRGYGGHPGGGAPGARQSGARRSSDRMHRSRSPIGSAQQWGTRNSRSSTGGHIQVTHLTGGSSAAGPGSYTFQSPSNAPNPQPSAPQPLLGSTPAIFGVGQYLQQAAASSATPNTSSGWATSQTQSRTSGNIQPYMNAATSLITGDYGGSSGAVAPRSDRFDAYSYQSTSQRYGGR